MWLLSARVPCPLPSGSPTGTRNRASGSRRLLRWVSEPSAATLPHGPVASRAVVSVVVLVSIALSWLGMMAVHELGHVINGWLSGGAVVRVVLDPFDLSHTEFLRNPSPLFVAWGGVVWGSALPLVAAAV